MGGDGVLGTGGEGLGRGGVRDNSGWNAWKGPWVSAFEQAPWEVGSVDDSKPRSPKLQSSSAQVPRNHK